jgi:hypothetical protein
MENYIKKYCCKDNNLELTSIYMYVNGIREDYSKYMFTVIYVNNAIDSLILNYKCDDDIAYKLYRSDTNELEFRRQIKLEYNYWLPDDHDQVFTERIVMRYDPINEILYTDIEYQYSYNCEIDEYSWETRGRINPF